jgi:hypothetical protein
MLRRCDGTDVNLTREIPADEVGARLRSPWPAGRPGFVTIACDCGRVFDDVGRLVTFPHQAF